MDSLSTKEFLPALGAFLCVAAAGGTVAVVLFFKYRLGKSWFPLPRLRWGRWSGTEVVMVIATMFLCQFVVFGVLQKMNFFEWFYEGRSTKLREACEALWITPLALPIFLALVFMGLRTMSGTYPVDLGLSLSRWQANLLLGFVAFVLITPLVLALHMTLSLLSDVKQHKFIELGKGGLDALSWCMLFVSATIAAPITEELLFRGVIQGWLRRASLAGHVTMIATIVFLSLSSSFEFKKPDKQPEDIEEFVENIKTIYWSRIVVTIGLGAIYVACLRHFQDRKLFLSEADFSPPRRTDGPEGEETSAADRQLKNAAWQAQDLEQQRQKSGLAILGSALAFAFCHPSWPDPVPLLLLGLALGWITQRTQNLLPAIVVHMLFNAVAGLTLLFEASFNSP